MDIDISQKQINKIGKKFRDNIHEDTDLDFLEKFRSTYDEIIVTTINNISEKLKKKIDKYIIVGRLKRTWSIIRKLQRKNNYGMDLTRMSDLAGLRIIISNIKVQDQVINLLNKSFEMQKKYDYRDKGQLYRSVHLILKDKNYKLIEVQIRTIAQHTWADESESFGEHAKQEIYLKEIGEYLKILSNLTQKIDKDENVDQSTIDNEMLKFRSPINGKFVRLFKFFNNFKITNDKYKTKYYLVVYDSLDDSLVSEDEFYLDDKNEIYELYKHKTNILDENRFEIIFFVSSLGKQVLKITHPRFFASNQFINLTQNL